MRWPRRIGGQRNKGFASMSPARRRLLGKLGGLTSSANGTAHKWTSDEAKAARQIAIEDAQFRRDFPNAFK